VGDSPEVTCDEHCLQNWMMLALSLTCQSATDTSQRSPQKERGECPDIIAPVTTREVQKALLGKLLEKVLRSTPVIQGRNIHVSQQR